jgi:cell division protein FtsW
MGEGTFVNRSYSRSMTGVKKAGRVHSSFDWVLVGTIIGLILFGLLMVFSAGPKFAVLIDRPADYFMKRQLMWAVAGIIALLLVSRVPYRLYMRWTVIGMVITIIMLIVVAILRDTTLGANRSLFSGSIRPSELAKLVIILYVSVWLTAKRDVLNKITLGLVPLMIILGLTGGLIMIQPDLSAAVTIIILGGILFFLAGGEWRQIALVIVATIFIGWVVVNVYPTGMSRITDYWAGLNNFDNASYHVKRSLEAIIKGGLFGVGFGHGSTQYTGLPVAPTDSIFAVIAEETGLIGCAAVITAYMVLLWRGLKIASRTTDPLGALVASGITIWIVLEALLNMAVMVNLLPHAGNALPFISYGGSNLLVSLIAVGILLNIARTESDQNTSNDGGPFASIVDLRWRDRRGRVSRSGRPASTRE